MKRPNFADNEIYHVFNRGVDKRKVFLEKEDYLRFIHDMYEFNDESSVLNSVYYFNSRFRTIEVEPQYIKERKHRKLLVEILAFALMPNHFHLLLRQKREQGIVHFMQKLGTGYTMFFNQKYKRSGSLFQGRYKSVHVAKTAHFNYLPFYIHMNPLELYRGSTSIVRKMDFLDKYRWSSYQDYAGGKNFPSVTSRDFLSQYMGSPKEQLREIRNLIGIKNMNFEEIEEICIDLKKTYDPAFPQ